MEWWLAFTIIVGALCALMVIGMPIAFAFLRRCPYREKVEKPVERLKDIVSDLNGMIHELSIPWCLSCVDLLDCQPDRRQ